MAEWFHLQDELQALSDLSTYEIPNEHDIHTEDPADLLESPFSLFLTSTFYLHSIQVQ